MSQLNTELKKYNRESNTTLHFKNLINAMKEDLFRLNITNDFGERVYVTNTNYITNGINIQMTDGTEFKLIKG